MSAKGEGLWLENKVAGAIDGSRIRGSGSVWNKPGDVLSKHKNVLVECKYSRSSHYALRGEVLSKIRREAREQGKLPVTVLHIDGELFTVLEGTEWIKMVDEYLEGLK